MGPADVILAERSIEGADPGVGDTTGFQGALGRVRVDGKFFARGATRVRVRGVTYGPFPPDEEGRPFPPMARVSADFDVMADASVNSIRTYHVPPEGLLELADARGISVLVDVPWAKHLCFLDDEAIRRDARRAVREAAGRGRGHPSVLGYSIANEVRPDVVRWHGARRVERFLAELADVARQADPQGLVTYANFPPTEYLDLSFADFVTFNVYLHDVETFRRYLYRLQNLVGDRPLLLGELGMDTIRHGEEGQAEFLAGHLREAALMGLAGTFVFSWTDEWHTGGSRIDDWAFGVTRADRSPKPAYHALAEVYGKSPAQLLPETPPVSVVVCSYNGGGTLGQCLRSLRAVDYPDYEVILVDDGSTDDTRRIAAEHPEVRTVHQNNHGLGEARNVGLRAAVGQIVAYTDSDCFADPDWLALLVAPLLRGDAAAVGGPNLTPDDGWLAACVAASPGQPTHVLENDQTAEHIPGCNMAFRREALESINGFGPQYRKAGDDVDICWRLQQAGRWITFAPGAFVWHHRRPGPRAYLGQQAGYGEAEGLLWFDHPDRFNGRGAGKWRGTMYGASSQGLRLGQPIIYRGTFAAGLFQTMYRPGVAHWAMLPGTLEWLVVALIVSLAAAVYPPAWGLVAVMIGLSLGVAGLAAVQAALPARYCGLTARLLIAGLSQMQPAVRSWARYRTRLFPPRRPEAVEAVVADRNAIFPPRGDLAVAYWDEAGRERIELLDRVSPRLARLRWAVRVDSGWSNWDFEVHCQPWTVVRICTAQEDHEGGRRLIRLRYRLRPSGYARMIGAVGLATTPLVAAISLPIAGAIAAVLLACGLIAWRGGSGRAARVTRLIDETAGDMGMIPCPDLAEARGKIDAE